MVLTRIDNAIQAICTEIDDSIPKLNWQQLSEKELLFELVLSILGSQTLYEIALEAAKAIEEKSLLDSPTQRFSKEEYENILRNLLSESIFRTGNLGKGQKYRFYATRSNYITETIWRLKENNYTLKGFLTSYKLIKEVRLELIKLVKGFGPKQASHFLRNIGFAGDIAVLDTHILHYLNLHGLIKNTIRQVSNLKIYEMVEQLLIDLIRKFEFPLYCVDQAIWIVIRVYKKELLT